jgi:uncharacterized protein
MENKNWLNNPAIAVILALVLLVITFYVTILSANAFKEGKNIGKAVTERDSVTITGEGRVLASPDVAQVSITIVTENVDAEAAQEENVEQFNKLVADLKELGIDEKDLKTTSYNVNPVYDWTDGERVDRGFEVRQSLQVKIRDLDKSGDVIRIASQNGVNRVGGLSFIVDNPEQYKEEARTKSLENAKLKAEELSEVLGVKLGKIISFSEGTSGGFDLSPVFRGEMMAFDTAEESAKSVTPDFEEGSEEIIIRSTIIYEVK